VHRGHGRPDDGRRRRGHGRHVAAVGPQAGHPAAALLPGGRMGMGDRGYRGRRARAQPRVPVVRGRHAQTCDGQVRTAGRQHR